MSATKSVGEESGDTILLGGIQFRGHHGDSPEERLIGGRFEVDLAIRWDVSNAEQTDSLADTVDYYRVHKRVMEIGQKERHRMLERLAGRLANMVIEEFGAPEVTVTVRKLMPPLDGIVGYAGVRITRRAKTT
ncbi:MAG: dihydroneopterin aldolase [Armatimonadetes bacterium]|jgi:dihydroneopterin aldolase|nr:dihydroneopterin aldolase [Armatimonadota bacterium]